jgi:hypothetical protein
MGRILAWQGDKAPRFSGLPGWAIIIPEYSFEKYWLIGMYCDNFQI